MDEWMGGWMGILVFVFLIFTLQVYHYASTKMSRWLSQYDTEAQNCSLCDTHRQALS